MSEITVVHYLNQFFTGFGGENQANPPVETRSQAVGPGRSLRSIVSERARIVATIIKEG